MVKKVFCTLLLLFSSACICLSAETPMFLKISPYARALGMAEAYTSLSQGTYGLFYNPAGLADVLGSQAGLSYVQWLQGTKYVYVSFITPTPVLGLGKLGMSLSMASAGRADAAGSVFPVDWISYPAGISGLNNYSGVFGGAFTFFDGFLLAGFNVKVLYNVLSSGESALNGGLDIGAILRFSMEGHEMRMGSSASNYGYALFSSTPGFDLPAKISIGISDKFDFFSNHLLISADTSFSNDTTALFKIGFEFWPFDFLSLRAGYKIAAYNHPAVGAGLKYGDIELHYAFEGYEGMGPTHAVSMVYSWWNPPDTGIKAEPELFSAAGRGTKVNIYPLLKDKEKALSYKVNIYDSSGKKLLRVIESGNKYAKNIGWDGKINGTNADDGIYMLEIEADYIGGGISRSMKIPVEADCSPPGVFVACGPLERRADGSSAISMPSSFKISLEDKHGVGDWEFIIRDHMKNVFFSRKGHGPGPDAFQWNGIGDKGVYAKTGRAYKYSVKSRDELGNEGESKPVEIIFILKEVVMTFSSDSLFDTGKSAVKISAFRSLKKIREMELNGETSEMMISGHTDTAEPSGSHKTRETLSLARAKAVRYYIRNVLGVKNIGIKVEGHGGALPVADNATKEGRAKNRRVEVRIRSRIYK